MAARAPFVSKNLSAQAPGCFAGVCGEGSVSFCSPGHVHNLDHASFLDLPFRFSTILHANENDNTGTSLSRKNEHTPPPRDRDTSAERDQPFLPLLFLFSSTRTTRNTQKSHAKCTQEQDKK